MTKLNLQAQVAQSKSSPQLGRKCAFEEEMHSGEGLGRRELFAPVHSIDEGRKKARRGRGATVVGLAPLASRAGEAEAAEMTSLRRKHKRNFNVIKKKTMTGCSRCLAVGLGYWGKRRGFSGGNPSIYPSALLTPSSY